MKKSHVTFLMLVVILILALILLFIMLFIIDKGNFEYWNIYIPCTGIGLFGLVEKLFIWFIESNTIRFDSIKEETFYYNDNFPDDAHYVLTILKETERDCFVLAYFKNRQEIKPAVYTIHKNRIAYLNLRVETTYFKKIYLDENAFENYIRVYRIKNKSTKSQMLFFAANIPINEIAADEVSVPTLTKPGQFGDFTVFGIEESSKQEYTSVTVNGVVYPLEIIPINFCFIGKNEVKFD